MGGTGKKSKNKTPPSSAQKATTTRARARAAAAAAAAGNQQQQRTGPTPFPPGNHNSVVNAELAKRLELLEQRFHSPPAGGKTLARTSTHTPALSGSRSTVATTLEYSNQSESHSQSQHSIGFPRSNNNSQSGGGGSNRHQHQHASNQSSSVASGSVSVVFGSQNNTNATSSNAATNLVSNARQGKGKHYFSGNSFSNSVSNSSPSKAFLEVNRAAEIHIRRAASSRQDHNSTLTEPVITTQTEDAAITVNDSSKVLLGDDVKDKDHNGILSDISSPKKRAASPARKKESSRKQSKPVKKLETTYNSSGSSGRKRSRLQKTLDGSNLSHPGNDGSSNHQRSRQPLSPPLHHKVNDDSSTLSRDKIGSNHTIFNGSTKKPLPKQRRIDSFISAVKKERGSAATSNSIHQSRQSRIINSADDALPQVGRKSPILFSLRSNSGAGASSVDKELEKLRAQCQTLEQLCNDKEERLKAVANNQTILHSSLKKALNSKEKELVEMRESHGHSINLSRKALENLVLAKSTREAKELRQKVANDGMRLGRLVYKRVGMHTAESWENGSAITSLEARLVDLKRKKAILEQRQRDVRKASRRTSRNIDFQTDNNNSSAPANGKRSDEDSELLLSDILDVMAADETIRMHLTNIKKQESALSLEMAALEKEKFAHIRELKRVACEDSSRFNLKRLLGEDRYVLFSLLGKGGFSEVWKAFDLVELCEVAVKIHELDPRWSESKKYNYSKHVSREYQIHHKVRHPRIVSLYNVFDIDDNSIATVLECCEGTDLDTMLKEMKTIPERDARAILLQILSGMRYLASPSQDGSRPGIIHYDLKPGNILFDEIGDAKITDFGLSKIVESENAEDSMELTSQGAGTYWYLPPECFITHENVRISNKVDVWSIGVIYYQMMFGRRPFGHNESQDRVLRNYTMLNAREVTFPSKPSVSNAAKKFIQTCLTYDQALRPSISELCEDRYLFVKKL